ncbi:MAG: hypothetical protein FWH04_04065 [Oscillospiraceae bacterium]|nr:hypothetical protein [Oscillospiraceae bacterium]
MKRTAGKLLSLMITLIFVITGCDYKELSNTLFISGLGIDITENGQYRVTAEAIVMDRSSEEGYTQMLIHEENATVMGAISDMISIASGKLDFSHCEVIILSKEACMGLRGLIEGFFRNKDYNISTKVLIAKNLTAQGVLSIPPKIMPSKSFEIKSAFFNKNSSGKTVEANLLSVYDSLHQSGSTVIPAVEADRFENEVALEGVALFKHDMLIGFLDGNETRLYNLVRNQIKQASLSVPYGEGEFFYAMVSGKSTTKAWVNGVIPHFFVSLRAGASFSGSYPGGASERELAGLTENYLRAGLDKLALRAKHELNIDLFLVQDKLKKTSFKQWDMVKNWDTSCSEIEYYVDCSVSPEQNTRARD